MKNKIKSFFAQMKQLFCGTSNESEVKIENVKIRHLEQFGAVEFDITKEELSKLGFNYGDSVNIEFDNGTVYNNVPYYDGLYAKTGEMILMSHPSAKYPGLFIICGNSAWDQSKVSTNNTATITLNERGKYKDIQEILSLDYSKNREDFESDIVFANFRTIKGGKIKQNLIYRGASPIDNSMNRASYAAKLIKENEIDYIVNLSDNEEKYKCFLENGNVTDYVKKKHDDGKMSLLALGINFRSEKNKNAVAQAFKKFAKNGKKVYIHCLEGKDRAGFVNALVLALADASSEEIEKDYMITYKNYNGITKESDRNRYDTIVKLKVPDFFETILDDENIKDYSKVSFQKGAKKYLQSGGLTEDEVENIVNFLTK